MARSSSLTGGLQEVAPVPVNGSTAKTYVTDDQYQSWKEDADRMDMTVSEYISSMVEAGRKKFTDEVEPDDTRLELRDQRNNLKRELERSRERITTLEDRLMQTEHRAIEQYVDENPGCTWDEVINHLVNTASERALYHLDAMEGDTIRRGPEDGFYPVEDVQ